MSVKAFRSVDVAEGDDASPFASSTTIAELVSQIPVIFRSTYGDKIVRVNKVAVKAGTCRNALTILEKHFTEGSFPKTLAGAIKDPRTQFSKEFEESTNGRTAREDLDDTIKQCRIRYLKALITVKKDELTELQSRLVFDKTSWSTDCTTEVSSFASSIGVTVTDDTDPSTYPDDLSAQLTVMKEHGESLWIKAITIAHATCQRELYARMSKLAVRQDTDTQMSGLEPSRDSIAKTIREEVRSALQSELSKQRNGMFKAQATLPNSSDFIRKRKTFQTLPTFETKGPEETQRNRKRQRKGERKEEVHQEVRELCRRVPPSFSYFNTDSFPDLYVHTSDRARLSFHYLHAPIEHLESIREFEPGIFKQDNVILPKDIEYTLSLNHKYILHERPDFTLLDKAWQKLVRTVRVKWTFRNSKDNRDFIPRFHVASNWNPPKAAPHIERGLDIGKDALLKQAARLNQDTTRRPYYNWDKVHTFLQSSMLLVKLTDKNLGLAVFTKDWYNAEVLKHLNDSSTYEKVIRDEPMKLAKEAMETFNALNLPEPFKKFLNAKTKAILPKFYVIPKVHKNPWASRPIVPSHSWVTSRMSEILDHLLRPLLKHFPWVVNSTRDVVKGLESAKYERLDKLYIVTGDVTAFYTNVPVIEGIHAIGNMYDTYITEPKVPRQVVQQMLDFVLNFNFFEYDTDVYHQSKGLAMGTSVAPLFANLYAASLEAVGIMATARKAVRLYVRYIDDILALIEGTEEELNHAQTLMKLRGFKISWDCSSSRREFLDLEILNTPASRNRLATRLYRKPMNKFLYIPFSSAHPLPVKKAFVKAELTRFIIICSEEPFFAETCRFFYLNLRRRGYPAEVLKPWFKQRSYKDRQLLWSSDEKPVIPVLLPSKYNEVWEYINVNELMKEVRTEWLKGPLPETLSGPLLKSLSRTTNLGDLIARWNLTMLDLRAPAPPPAESTTAASETAAPGPL